MRERFWKWSCAVLACLLAASLASRRPRTVEDAPLGVGSVVTVTYPTGETVGSAGAAGSPQPALRRVELRVYRTVGSGPPTPKPGDGPVWHLGHAGRMYFATPTGE